MFRSFFSVVFAPDHSLGFNRTFFFSFIIFIVKVNSNDNSNINIRLTAHYDSPLQKRKQTTTLWFLTIAENYIADNGMIK